MVLFSFRVENQKEWEVFTSVAFWRRQPDVYRRSAFDADDADSLLWQ
jgi:hypothetical protein